MPAKILIVEDCDVTRKMLALLLSLAGEFTVLTAEDGLRGAKVVETEQPDLIITDINMPHLSGVEMIILLRGQPQFGEVPIMVISACDSGDLGDALRAGANRAMRKPIEVESFVGCVKQMLGNKGQRDGLCSKIEIA
jgi:CheY-like chemotaxis protein